MRIITRQSVYRAFPELDGFTDEQCRRFVRAANGGVARQARLGAACLGSLAVLAGVTLLFVRPLWERLAARPPYAYDLAIEGLAIVAYVGGILVCVLLVRDGVIRRRVRRVLRRRGYCAVCHYLLLGLAVSEELKVRCPECGTQSEADPAMGELSVSESGARMFTPSEMRVAEKRWLTARVKRNVRRGAAVVVVGVVVAALSAQVIWWYQTKADQKAAAAAIKGPRALTLLMESRQPAGVTAQTPNAADEFRAIADQILAIQKQNAAAVSPGKLSLPSVVYPDFSTIGVREMPILLVRETSEERELRVFKEPLDEKAYLAVKSAGLLERIDAAAEMERYVIDFGASEGVHSFPTRVIAQLARARMRLAFIHNNKEEFVAVAGTQRAMMEMTLNIPLVIGAYQSQALAVMQMLDLRTALLQQPDREWVEVIDEVVSRLPAEIDLKYFIEGECLSIRDAIAKEFVNFNPNLADVAWSIAMKGDWSLPYTDFDFTLGLTADDFSIFDKGRLSDRLEDFDRMIERACRDDNDNPEVQQKFVSDPEPSAPFSELQSSIDVFCSVMSSYKMTRGGLATMAALEKYRHDHGAYPSGLEALIPGYLTEMPMDMYDGKPLRYRAIDAEQDRLGRGYLLWSVGRDLMDDGGKERDPAASYYGQGQEPGTDWIINSLD